MSSFQIISGLASSSVIQPFLGQILTLHNSTFPTLASIDDCHGVFEDPTWILVLRGSSRVIAMVCLGHLDDKSVWIYNVAVTKYQRRQSIGTFLARRCLELFPTHTSFQGSVHSDNVNAQLFFSGFGAIPGDVAPDGYMKYTFNPQAIDLGV